MIDPKAVILTNENLSDEDGMLRLKYGQLSIIDVDATAAGPGFFKSI